MTVGVILAVFSATERRRYIVTSSSIVAAYIQQAVVLRVKQSWKEDMAQRSWFLLVFVDFSHILQGNRKDVIRFKPNASSRCREMIENASVFLLLSSFQLKRVQYVKG